MTGRTSVGPMNRKQIASLRFLVAESGDMQQVLRRLLVDLGASRIGLARADEEARRRILTDKPDVVIVAHRPPAIDGVALTRWIRAAAAPAIQEAAVIMTTAQTEPAQVRAARDAGVNAFLARPVSIEALDRRITAAVAGRRPFVRAADYAGPDRRRTDAADYAGPRRRDGERPAAPPPHEDDATDLAELDI